MNILDFNDVRQQKSQGHRQKIDVEQVKGRMADNYQAVLFHLLPGGRFDGDEFVCGDISGRAGNSLKVSARRDKLGVGEDFATGEKFGDLIDLWKSARKVDFPTAIEQAAQFLSINALDYSSQERPRKKQQADIGPPTAQYNYTDENAVIQLVVYRHDYLDDKGEPRKTFKIWNAVETKWEAPKSNRPLFNRHGIAAAEKVVLVEGEKAANALISAGVPATSAMGGSKAPTDKTDWAPLRGKNVLIWPDNDPTGLSYAHAAAQAVRASGAVSVMILPIPTGKPEGWDAADAAVEGINLAQYVSEAQEKAAPAPDKPPGFALPFKIIDWQARRFKKGDAPDYKWLVEGVIPLGTAGMLAALGGVGKGLLTLDLALKVACPVHPSGGMLDITSMALGGSVRNHGTAVIFTAEDDQDEMHRRIDRLDPDGLRHEPGSKLYVIPLPNAGGPMPLISSGREGPHTTPYWDAIKDQLMEIPDLRLVVFDPLASFVHADINADPAVGAFVCGQFASLATETGATVMVCHHMTKGSSKSPIITPEIARDMVRGSSALVDGLRWTYAMWSAAEEEGKKVCKKLATEWKRNTVCQGAIVKKNFPADETVRTFIRQPVSGLLVDRTHELRSIRADKTELVALIMEAVERASKEGKPFTQHGPNSAYTRRHELPDAFHEISKRKLNEDLIQTLLNEKKIVKAVAKGSKTAQWLDVPSGPFALGVGQFSTGASNDGKE